MWNAELPDPDSFASILKTILYTLVLLMRKTGTTIQWLYSFNATFVLQQTLSIFAIAYCNMETLCKPTYMVVIFVTTTCGIFFFFLSLQHLPTHHNGFLFLVQATRMFAFLIGFVYLTDEIDKRQGIDSYAVGFFLSLFLNFTTLMKLLRLSDIFGIPHSLMALSVYLLVKFPTAIRKSMWVVAFFLDMFEMAPVRLRLVEPLPIQGGRGGALVDQGGLIGEGVVTMEAVFGEHKTDIKGIALPQQSHLLYSVSKNGKLQIFSRTTFHCIETVNLWEEVGSLISKGTWVFIGLRNNIKAYKVGTTESTVLTKPSHPVPTYINRTQNRPFVETMVDYINTELLGLVTAMMFVEGMLFAGTSYGLISCWRFEDRMYMVQPFPYIGTLKGSHDDKVTSLVAGGGKLFSGSADFSIKVWSLSTRRCVQTLRQHSDTVSSLFFWDQLLLSSSLDGTLKTWHCSGNGLWDLVSSRTQGQSVHALCGMYDLDGRPIILCSYQNGTVGIYNLQPFTQRGTFSSPSTIETFTVGSEGLLLSGGVSGKMHAWRLTGN
ncbi:zinc finger CCCH domain-containing protein 62 [Capsella rubella]|uniref:zinc finger CCCH domain-containing protein 62 n=1 Tax=Capsella rubella TaxID=81985 RepID=UPI000CD59391|nr:zinc finger CCCH domain-containing protein 62 [Capsella rubella]